MKLVLFSTQQYDRNFFNLFNSDSAFQIEFFEEALTRKTADLAQGADAVCVFVNDKVNATVMEKLAGLGIKVLALRCAGFNNVDLEAAKKHNIKVCRVPAYSPRAVAEHAVAMILTLNRKTHKAYNRVREQNFSLNGLLGFDLFGKTVGVIGTGNIGKAFCRIMKGFGCNVLAFDLHKDNELIAEGIQYMEIAQLLEQSDIISLHCPLNNQTKYLINDETIASMKKGVMLINTSRGGLINTNSVIAGLKSKHIAYLGIDVYEQEEQLFFRDLSANIIEDDTIQRLTSFPNVLVTAHQAFFTNEALEQITVTTLRSVTEMLNGVVLSNPAVALV